VSETLKVIYFAKIVISDQTFFIPASSNSSSYIKTGTTRARERFAVDIDPLGTGLHKI